MNIDKLLTKSVSYEEILGSIITSLRKGAKITQAVLAEHLGVTCSTVSRMETGYCHVFCHVAKTAQFFGKTPSELLAVCDARAKELVEAGYTITY